MTSTLINYMCYLIILSVCVGNSRNDDYYYGELSLEQQSVHYDYRENIEKKIEDYETGNNYNQVVRHSPKSINTTKFEEKHHEYDVIGRKESRKKITETVSFSKRMEEYPPPSNTGEARWLKFEELLLAMGKRYDWKNDRWIKVKNGTTSTEDSQRKSGYINRLEFLSKHKFSYRTVKLNRAKTKRNIVIAVTAVR